MYFQSYAGKGDSETLVLFYSYCFWHLQRHFQVFRLMCWSRQPAKRNMLCEVLRQECHCTHR